MGIDFGTYGSGLAYALPDGSSYIHNLWDNEEPTIKPKTSVLLDKDLSVIDVGAGAQGMFLRCKKDKGWKLFERFKMNLYKEPNAHKWREELTSDEEKNQNVVDLNDEIQTANGDKELTENVFVAQLEYLKDEAFKFIWTHFEKQYKLTGDRENGWNEVQYFLTVPGSL